MKQYGIMIKLLSVFFLFGLFIACSEEDGRRPFESNAAAPAPVANVQSESLPGAVKLTFDLPNDKNILYTRAVVNINGAEREVKVSSYRHNLTIEGFPDTRTYDVNLYTVSRSEVSSAPVPIQVQALEAPYEECFRSLTLARDFGGATVSFKNPHEAELAITILYIDHNKEWSVAETYYTKKKEGIVSARGFAPEKMQFGVYVKDRWNNLTDTLKEELTPIFEKKLDITKFREVNLPGDQLSAWGWTMPHIWDGDIQNNTNIDKAGFHTGVTGEWPQHFTFDLGVRAKLSRYKYYQRGKSMSFADRNIKKFEIWGSLDPNPDGSFDDSWKLLLTGESVKPSGLPVGELSDEDIALIVAGEEFTFPADSPIIRYIRIRVLETWSGAQCFYIMQVALWGAEESELNAGK